MLALYVPRDSLIHRLDAAFKLSVLAAFALALSFVSDKAVLAISLGGIIALFAMARLPMTAVFAALRPALIVIVMLAALQAVFGTLDTGLTMILRIGAIILAAALLTYTTRFSDMIACLTAAMRPLAVLGLSPAKVGLALALAIRFIPVLMTRYQDVQDARLARGASSWSIYVLGPVLLNAIKMADEISDAVIARGFEERDSKEDTP